MTTTIQMETQPKMSTVRARGQWEEGMRTEINIRNFDPITMDEPADLGGTDRGPNPMEYLLGSLIGCEAVLVAIVAQERGFEYTDLKFDLRGQLDLRGLEGVKGVRPYFEKITGTIKVETTETQEALDALAKKAESRCPAYTVLEAAGVTFEIDWVAVKP